MRKMTYKEAAKCDLNIKARVTTEQSEKMQKAWIENGNPTGDGFKAMRTNDRFIYLYGNRDLSSFDSVKHFVHHENEEIELIDDEISDLDFASQQDVWQWLAQGNQIISKDEHKDIVYFLNGELVWQTGNQCTYKFADFQEWQKHTQPRLIRVNGVEVPAPLESLDGLKTVWIPCASAEELALERDIESHNPSELKRLLELGMLYANKEDAIARAEAMRKFEVI